jgi:2-oxoglutarate dehydrogenase E1 component
MTEQTPNAAFQASSFLQGTNADYLDQLAARYAEDPANVDAQWAEFFRLLGDSGMEQKRAAEGPSWARKDWPPQPTDDLTAAMTGEWPAAAEAKGAAKRITEKAAEKGISLNDAQVRRSGLGPRHHADPRLPHPGPPRRRPRPAWHCGARQPPRA